MYITYLGGVVVIVASFVSMRVIVMGVVVMRPGRRTCSRVMITLGAVVVVPIAGGVPMQRFPSPRLM
jgi:hypothetical protein